jgi:hypothetical protein
VVELRFLCRRSCRRVCGSRIGFDELAVWAARAICLWVRHGIVRLWGGISDNVSRRIGWSRIGGLNVSNGFISTQDVVQVVHVIAPCARYRRRSRLTPVSPATVLNVITT